MKRPATLSQLTSQNWTNFCMYNSTNLLSNLCVSLYDECFVSHLDVILTSSVGPVCVTSRKLYIVSCCTTLYFLDSIFILLKFGILIILSYEFHVVKGVKVLFYQRSSVNCPAYLWYMYQGGSLLQMFLSVAVTYLNWNYLYVGIPSNSFIIIEFPFSLSIYAGCQLWSYIGL